MTPPPGEGAHRAEGGGPQLFDWAAPRPQAGTGAEPAPVDTSAVPLRAVPQRRRHAAVSPPTGLATAWARSRWTVTTLGVAGASFLCGLLALSAAAWIGRESFFGTAVRWDTAWYYRISQLGYVGRLPTNAQDYAALRPAFFPGLPLLERLVHSVLGGPPGVTTLVVGLGGLVASCLLLRAYVALEWGEEVAWRAVVLFAFFPGAYVFVMAYSEALAIPLAIFALYALRRQWFVAAGVATALATGTRLLGLALVVACLIAAVRQVMAWRRQPNGTDRSWRPVLSAVAAPLIGVSGLVAYMAYLAARTGSFVAFQTAERVGWYNTVSFLQPIRSIQDFADRPFHFPSETVDALGVVVVLGCLAIAVFGRLRLEEKGYAVVILAAWLFTANTGAWFRFILSAFPVLIVVANRLGRRWYPAAACAGAMLLGILVVLFGSAVSFSP